MMGSTHKSIGVAAGVSVVIYGAFTGHPMYALGILTAPIGAMWPDIDHDHTKIGAKRKEVISNLRKVAIVFSILSVALFAVNVNMGFLDTLNMLKISGLMLAGCLTFLLATSTFLKKKVPFFSKHRGIMHTLFMPVVLTAVSLKISNDIVSGLTVGLTLGYISHLLADCLTTDGCPLVWPLTQKCVSFLGITTDTGAEKVVATLLSGVFIVMGYFASQYDNLLLLSAVAIISLAAGKGIAKDLAERFKKAKHNIFVTPIIPIIFITMGSVVTSIIAECGCFCFGVGYGMYLMSGVFKKKTKKKK